MANKKTIEKAIIGLSVVAARIILHNLRVILLGPFQLASFSVIV